MTFGVYDKVKIFMAVASVICWVRVKCILEKLFCTSLLQVFEHQYKSVSVVHLTVQSQTIQNWKLVPFPLNSLVALLLYWIVLECLNASFVAPLRWSSAQPFTRRHFWGERWKKISHSMITKPFSRIFLDNVWTFLPRHVPFLFFFLISLIYNLVWSWINKTMKSYNLTVPFYEKITMTIS